MAVGVRKYRRPALRPDGKKNGANSFSWQTARAVHFLRSQKHRDFIIAIAVNTGPTHGARRSRGALLHSRNRIQGPQAYRNRVVRDEFDVRTHSSVRSAVLVITLIISFKTVTRNARLKGRDEDGGWREVMRRQPAKGMAWRPRGLRIERARGGAERARDPIIESSHQLIIESPPGLPSQPICTLPFCNFLPPFLKGLVQPFRLFLHHTLHRPKK